MSNSPVITAYSCLANHRLSANGALCYETDHSSSDDFLIQAYHSLQLNYPKFYKMDQLSKTAFLAVEVLLQQRHLQAQYRPEEMALVISNANASLDTDLRYEKTMNSVASPALFVYTLPNIMAGEIAIRHRLKGESACFVFDIFDPAFQTTYVNLLLNSGKAKACISGWADFFDGKAEAFFYLAELTTNHDYLIHDSINVSKIYSALWKN